MPLLDLSLVTQAVVKLIEERVKEILARNPVAGLDGGAVHVSPLPPDRLAGAAILGLHLYHVAEDPHLQGFKPPMPGAPPVGEQPMGWRLCYQLGAHSDLPGKDAVYRAQTLLGLAMKALHDFPVVDASSHVGATTLLPPALQGAEICLRISALPESPGAAALGWTASSTSSRLGTCYQVSVVGSSRRSQ